MANTLNPHDLAARVVTAQRRESAQFHCDECPLQFFSSEGAWWRHVETVHAADLADLTEEALESYRASKKEQCRCVPAEYPLAVSVR